MSNLSSSKKAIAEAKALRDEEREAVEHARRRREAIARSLEQLLSEIPRIRTNRGSSFCARRVRS